MAKQHIHFNARTIAERIPPGNKAQVALENNIGNCYCWTTKDGLSATAITDNEYPERAAFILLNQLIMDFRENFPDLGAFDAVKTDTQIKYENMEIFLKKWQDPTEADKLMKIEKELLEVKEIIHKNLADLLKKGE